MPTTREEIEQQFVTRTLFLLRKLEELYHEEDEALLIAELRDETTYMALHKLAGSGGLFGYHHSSEAADILERIIDKYSPEEAKNTLPLKESVKTLHDVIKNEFDEHH